MISKFNLKKTVKKRSVWFMVLSNLLVLFGVLFLNWSIFEILAIFIIETAIVGFYNILKMAAIRTSGCGYKGGMILFFIIHFGMFVGIQSIFVIVFSMVDYETLNMNTSPIADSGNDPFRFLEKFITIAFLFFSHGYSHYKNYMQKKEYLNTDLNKQMMAPYQLVVIQQVVILFGGFSALTYHTPIIFIVLLIGIKIVIDLWAYHKESKENLENSKFIGTPE